MAKPVKNVKRTYNASLIMIASLSMKTTFDSPASFNNKESTADMLKTASPLAGRILFTACATLPYETN